MRKNIVLSMQEAELAELDNLAAELKLSRSAAVRLLVTMYYERMWTGAERRTKTKADGRTSERSSLTNERKVE